MDEGASPPPADGTGGVTVTYWLPPLPQDSPPPSSPPNMSLSGLVEWQEAQLLADAAPPAPLPVVFHLCGVAVARVDERGAWEKLLGQREKRRLMQRHTEEVAAVKDENKKLKAEVHAAQKAKGAAEGHLSVRLSVAESDRLLRQKEAKATAGKLRKVKQVNAELEVDLDEVKDKLKAATTYSWRSDNSKQVMQSRSF